ncbi:hypothetical protein Zmor_009994 [Zophobas morio]|uniref:Uncharacterized protein n=1 Tax=Zophobas morio TaxID=2755281 RepID=A0AA38IPV9_9CUCU|nr:hypothetical protein Zmor_009994 [Zophobas morio]
MKNILALVYVLVTLNSCLSLQLPPGFKKCDASKPDFNSCLSEAIPCAIKQLTKPIPEYGLPQLEPFLVPEKSNCEFGNETMAIRQKYSNFRLYGLTKIDKGKAVWDCKNKALELELYYDKIVIVVDYELVGRIVLLPVNVSTKVGVELSQTVFKLKFSLDEYKGKDGNHFKVVDATLKIVAKNMKVNYKNLFKNKLVDKAMCEDFNTNWQDILEYWQKVLPKVYAEPFGDAFSTLLEKVPVKNLVDGVE